MKAVRIVFTGHVQGVGLRWECKKTADKLHLRGYVANQSDGTVLLMCQGPQEAIRQLIHILSRPASYAHIESVSHTEVETDEVWNAFTIRYS